MDDDWTASALCAQILTDDWFPNDGDHHAAQRAIAICNQCPVRARCLTEGLNESEGIWGGTTPRQRARLRKGAA